MTLITTHHFCYCDFLINQAIYVPADDLTDPAPATTFAHLDATTVLSRGIAELGIYPAVDPLDSTSRILDRNVVGEEHYGVARDVQKVLQVFMKFSLHFKKSEVCNEFLLIHVLGLLFLLEGYYFQVIQHHSFCTVCPVSSRPFQVKIL